MTAPMTSASDVTAALESAVADGSLRAALQAAGIALDSAQKASDLSIGISYLQQISVLVLHAVMFCRQYSK